MTKVLWRWEQDGSGGKHGTATYFIGQHNETTVQMPSFHSAHQFHNAIAASISEARWDARANYLNQIMRIEL